jgi:hypothetical protein
VAVAKKYGSVAKARSSIKSSASGAGIIQRVQAGEPKMVRFQTEPNEWYEAYFHWPEGGQPTWCPGGEKKSKDCTDCQNGESKRKAVLATVFDRASGQIAVLQMTPTAADGVLARYEKFGESVRTCDYEIRREGNGLNTKYVVDYEPKSKFNYARYEDQLPDIGEVIEAEMAAQGNGSSEPEDDDEDEEPRSTRRSSSRPKARKRPEPEDEEDEEEEFDDDEDEDEEDERPARRRSSKPSRPARRSSHEDEDDEDDEDDEEEEDDDEDEDVRPARRSSSRRPSPSRKKSSRDDGLDEFKPSKSRHPEARAARLKRNR